MEALLGFALVGALLSALVQFLKRQTQVEPLVILSALSVGGGVVYAALLGLGYWDLVVKHVLLVASVANSIYTVLNAVGAAKSQHD